MEMTAVGQCGFMPDDDQAEMNVLLSCVSRSSLPTSIGSDNDSAGDGNECTRSYFTISDEQRHTQPDDIYPQRISTTLLNLLERGDFTTHDTTQDLQYIFDCVEVISQMNTKFGRACMKALEAHVPELFQGIYRQCFRVCSVSPTLAKSDTITNMKLIGDVLWTGTDTSEMMCQKVLMTGIAEDIFEYLDDDRFRSPSQLPGFVVKKCVRPLLSVLHNTVQMCGEASATYRKAGAVEILVRFNTLDDIAARCVLNFLLAHIIPEDENEKFSTNDENIAFVVQILRKMCDKSKTRVHGFCVCEMLSGINKLAVNDANKKCIVRNNALPLYTRLMRSESPSEQRLAAEGVWQLSFTNGDDIAEEKHCLEALNALVSGDDDRLKQVALMTLHNVEGTSRRLTAVSSGQSSLLQDLPKEKKVFISYEKSTEILILDVAAKLKETGFYVIKNETNTPTEPSLFAQLTDNDVSPCGVIVAASRKYQNSPRCRQEATRAELLAGCERSGVNIVPIIAEEGYVPDGWLLYMLMKFPCAIDCTLSTQFETKVSELIVALSKKDISGFIRTHVKHRTCCRYIRDECAARDRCCCGREKNQHDDHTLDLIDDYDGSTRSWDIDKHTMQTEASCFGTVKFFGFGSDVKQEAPYVRVDHTTRMGTIWTLLVKYWNMPPPKLIISVIGGAENFAMNRQLRSSFKRSLVSAATSAGAWVISSGTQDGVAGLVGEAFREYVPSTFDHKPVVLGIANWGVIDKKRTLESYNGEGRFPAAYTASPAWGRSSEKVPLEHNHTHFLLVDNGTERKFNTELNFRSNLERYLADSLTRSQDDQVPVVLVVLGGGEDTLLRVAEVVEMGTPTVVIAGTGHAADLIATVYSKAKTRSERVTLGKTYVEQMCRTLNWPMSAAITLSTDAVSGEMSKSVEYLNRILEQKALVTVCTPSDAGEPIDIDCVILEALAKDTKYNPVSQLRLALDWNRSDIAAKHIVDIANSGKRKDVELEHNMMFTALMQNQVDFVKLFIDSGFDLSKFLTVSRLNQLYLTMFRDGSVATVDLFRHLMEHVQSFRAKLRRPRPETYSLTNVGKAINFLLGVKTSSMYDENKEKFDYPERELMYWALLFDRQELANFLWSHCRDPLGAALTAATLLTALARHANNDEKVHLWNDLNIHAREFGELAVGVLNECHINDTLLAQRLLVRPLDTWSKKTPLMIARGGKQMSFMEHACTQAKLNRLWMGNMSVNTSVWKIIFLLFPFIKFSSSEKGDDCPRRVKWRVSTKLLDGRHASFTQAAIHFVSAPVTKFYFHTVSFVVFMALFSYIVMTNLRPTSEAGSPAVSEYVLWAWGVTLVIEEMRQAYSTGSDYLNSAWNRFDLLGYSTLTLAVILRYTVPDSNFAVARMTYCVALIVFYLRFMQVFFIEKHIGPTVIAMRRMVTDVMFFMCILLVFMVSYGTVVQALRYPNSLLSWSLLSNVIYHPFWFIHGQFNQDEMEGNVGACYRGDAVSSTSHGLPRCPETSMLLMPISGLYLVVANVLLLNLLIAMFSNTFQTVHGKSETLWRYYLYDLIHEYFDKPVLPSPLIVFSHLYTVLQLAVTRPSRTCTDKPGPDSCDNAFCRHFSPSINDELTKFERQSTEKYLLKKRQLCNERIDTKVQSTRERIDKMAADLEDIKERMKSQNNLLRTMLEQCEPTRKH